MRVEDRISDDNTQGLFNLYGKSVYRIRIHIEQLFVACARLD